MYKALRFWARYALPRNCMEIAIINLSDPKFSAAKHCLRGKYNSHCHSAQQLVISVMDAVQDALKHDECPVFFHFGKLINKFIVLASLRQESTIAILSISRI